LRHYNELLPVFFNKIGPEPKYALAFSMSAFGDRPDQGLRGLRSPLLTDSNALSLNAS
jgi:hypothetical protein